LNLEEGTESRAMIECMINVRGGKKKPNSCKALPSIASEQTYNSMNNY
jgi:hypothetical protein